MEMVTTRRRDNDRLGLMLETMFSLSGKTPPREALVIRFHKSKDRKSEYADATYSIVNYCPFCGTKVTP